MENDLNFSGTSSTGVNTSNPQSGAANTSLAGQQQSLQNVSNSSSINVHSSATPIILHPTSLTTAAVRPFETKTSHPVPAVGIGIIAALVIVAAALCIYIYQSSKKSFQNI